MKKPTILRMPHLNLLALFSKRVCTSFKTIFVAMPFESTNKKRFLSNALAMVGILLFMTQASYGQIKTPFTPRLSGGNLKVKGDVVLIGNSIIGRTTTLPIFSPVGDPNGIITNQAVLTAEANQDYNGTASNNASNVEYIDIDTDNNTFSSSSADLLINNSCKRIAFAGLYWTSIYPNDRGTDKDKDFVGTPRKNDWNEVLFKVPNGDYVKLVADNNPDPVGDEDQIIFDGYDPVNINNSFKDSPIICYKNVTNLLSVLSDADGTYTVANLRATLGRRNGGGAGGWTLVVIYESPTMPSKFISVFDGYAGVQSTVTLDIPVAGFKTLPAPFPVNARIGVGALEGDLGIKNDSFQFRSGTPPPTNPLVLFTKVSNTLNPSGTNYPTDGNDNFFNSTITYLNNHVTTRKPKSENTIGYDIDVLDIPNALNGVIPNGETQGTLRLTTTGDGYGAFLTTFAVDIIEPTILLTKEVFDDKWKDASNANVILGQQLNYVIGFENQGNDDATGFTIKDVLPKNIDFVYPDDIDLASLPTGVTHSYNAATRTLIFNIPDALVKKSLTPGGPFVRYEIRFKVKVKPNCNALEDRCDNVIKNSAYATYKGVVNPTQITDDPSISKFTACNLGLPQPTNFLVGINDCIYSQSQVLCEASKTLNGPSGYASYSWTGPFGFTASTETVTVTLPGVYKVYAVGIAPCTDYKEDFTVTPFGGTVVNPIIAYADNKNPDDTITVCPNNGKELPKIFLCGLTGSNSSRTIATGITGATSIVWETTTCSPIPANLSDLCANEDASCTWTSAGPNGPNFVANTAGQFRVTINYDGGCFNRFYFNVYKNTLDFDVTATDIICATPGKIIVNKLPSSGYKYSIDGTNYQSSNTFNITTQNSYTVYVRQVGVLTNPCIFEINNITVRQRNFTVTANASQPLCFGDKGNVLVVANDVEPQYTFNIYTAGGTTPISTSGLQMGNQFTFGNLSPGNYDVEAIIENGCSRKQRIVINALTPLTASVDITKPITCKDGELTVTASGGIAPYNYSINGAPFVTSNVFAIPSPGGTYSIRVVDKNNCSYTIPDITINANPKPVFTIAKTDVLCYGAKSGAITFNVANANGYTLAYSIDNGATPYVANGTFSGLAPGVYTPILKYSLSGVDCFETQPDITITEPAAALTASAGVSELAGCGPAREGKVRITNPQGGVPPYEYNFNNPANASDWTTVNDAYKAPGTYTLYVRDANKCIFSASVIVDPEPAEPVIEATPQIDYNCDGTATSTVTVANPTSASYSFEYYLDGVKNTNVPSNVFVNVPSGSYFIKVEYKLNAVPTFSNLLFENFGYGDDTTSPGMNATYYCFERQVVATQCRGSNAINDGDYSVTSFIVNPFGAWVQPGDHTPQTVPPTPKGRCLVVNIGDKIPVTEILYEKVINNIIPNQPINVEFFAMNLLNKTNTQFNPDLRVALVDAAGTEISWYNTGDIPKSEKWENYPKTPTTLNPGSNTTLKFIVRSNVRQTSGNDVAIDDIKVFQLPKTCISSRSFPLTIDPGKAFTAQITGPKNVTCNGLTNGEFTITATNFDTTNGYQYSVDNGTTWSTALFTSPVTVNNLAGNLYKVIVRPVGSSVAACAKPFDVTISVPTALTLSASVKPPATCTTGATIKASGGGGTPAYQYELRQSDGITVVTAYSNNGGVFTNVPSGSYTVFVKDANGCEIPVGVSVSVTAPPALTAAVVPSTALCFDPTTGAQINVSITGGTAPYSYQTRLYGGAFSASSATFTTPSFTHTAAVTGNYVFRVTDINGCSFDTAQQVINAKVTANASVTTDLDCDVAPGSPDAVITGTISGGTAPFTVVLTSGQTTGTLAGPVGTATTFTYTTGVSGTYQFEITDAIGCKTTTSATINAKVAVTGNAVVTNETCETLNNGSVTLQVLTGVAPFEYSFNGSVFSSTVTYGSLLGSVAGTSYPYQIRDRKGCIYDGTAVVFEPTPITLSASITTPYTCTTNATITASASNGNGGFTYVLRRGATTVATNTTGLFPNLTVAGSYTVTATDAKGCPLTSAPMAIDALTPPTAMTFTNTLVTCPTNKTDITIDTYTGGSLPVEYRISAPAAAVTPFQSSATFTNLDPGVTYRFEIRDAKNCLFSTTYSVPVLPTLSASGVVVSNVVCVGESNGSIRYTVGGFGNNTPYSYTIDGIAAGSASSPLTGTTFDILVSSLAAGPHILAITNTTTNCSATATATVAAPSAPLAITPPTISPITCTKVTASITINTAGGWGSNSYTVTGITPAVPAVTQSTKTFNNLAAGDYTATVTDANGCIVSIPFTIAPYTALVLTPTVTAACSVAGNTNQIVATATGGSGTYTYSINTGVAPTGALLDTFNVAPGTYTITVRDAFGCADTEVVTVNQVLAATAVRTKDITCSPPAEATIRVDVTGGKADFGYRVNIGGTGFSGPVFPFPTAGSSTLNYTATSLTGTSYQFEITDANGCTRVTNTVNTNTPTPVAASTSITDLTCFQSGNGVVTITPTAGVAPFEYSFNGSGFSTVSTYSNLAASTGLGYPFVVRDSKGCLYPGFAVVNQPNEILVTVSKVDMTCSAAIVLGSVTVDAITNGVAPFTYVLRNLTTGAVLTHPDPTGASFTFANLSFGNFEVIVSDATGCSKTVTGIQVLAPPDDLDINLLTTADCTNGATIIVSVNPVVIPPVPNYEFGIYDLNVAPFSTSLLPPDGAIAPINRQKTFTNLTPGVIYTFVVRDNITGCYYFEKASGPVPPATLMTVSPPVVNNVTCTGTATGSVTFTISNYDATTVNWEIFTDQTNVSTGIFGSISTPAPSTITTPSGLVPGTYYVKFTEVGGSYNGCTSASATFSITESPVLLDLNASATKNDNCNTNAGQIVGVANGGTAPYLYQIVVDNGPIGFDAADTPLTSVDFISPTHNPSTFNVESGNYLVWVKDSRGCIINKPVTVLLDPTPVIALSVVNKCVAEGAFEILVTETTPGMGTHTISLDGGDFTSLPPANTFTGLNSGPHTVTIKDANGCTDTKNITIAAPLKVIPFIDALPTCANNDGQVTLTASGGTGAGTYSYTISPSPVGVVINNATGVISSLPAGTYTITMSDLPIPTNCTTTTEVILIAPTAVAYTATPTAPSCTGTQGNIANGTIDIILDATNDNPPYTYTITRTAPTAAAPVTQSTGLFTGLIEGTYDILVSSARGCSTPDTVVVLDPTPVVASASASAFTCSPTNTLNATVVTVTASGGAGTALADYTFSRDNVNWSSTNTFDVIDTGAAQNLTFFAKDANGCIDDIIVPIAAFPKLVSANASLVTQANCNTPIETINVAITGGATPTNFSYQVAIDGGAYDALTPITAGATSFTYPATSIGSFYEFKITDITTGCSIISNAYTVPVFNTMTVTASAAANVDCATNDTGAIEINIGNYTGPYTYEIFNGAVTTGFTGTGNTTTNPFVLPHGLVVGNNYTVVVTQTAYPSCPGTSNVVIITEPAALDLTNLSVNVKNQNCNTTGAVLTVDDTTIVGGTPGFEFAFVPTGTSPIGFYSPSKTITIATSAAAITPDLIDVYVKDTNGCFRFVTVPISLDPLPTVTASAVSQCPSPTGYTIIAVGAGGVGTLEYSLDGNSFQSSSSLTVTAPGDYDVWVRDANGCIAKTTAPVTIFEPLQLQADVTTLSTCLNADGVVTLTASGGSIPSNYEYSSNGTTYVSSNVFGGLAASVTPYTFYVRDITTTCVKSVDVIMLLPNTAIDFVPVATPVTCDGGNDGTITANMAPSTLTVNNNPIYTYALTGTTTVGNLPVTRPTQASPLFSGLAAGTYTVTVTSGRLCPVSQTIDVIEPAQIIVPTITPVQFACTTGNTGNLATITVDPTLITGGSGTYLNYEFIKNGTSVYLGPNSTYTEANLSGGSYIVNVYDNKGCMGTTTAPITIAPYIQLDKVNVVVDQAITCTNLENITVTATTIGGPAANLQYTLVDVTYDDTTTPPTVIKGSVYPAVTITNGIFTNLPVGNYEITVRNLDTNCEITSVHYVNNPNTFDLTIDNVVDVTCFVGNNGSARVTLIDRVPTPIDNAGPFDYTVYDIANPLAPVVVVPTTNSPTFGPITLTGLAAGTYMITATLMYTPNCTVSKNFTITGPSEILAISETHTEITCVTGNNDGSISATATGGWPGGYEFQLENGATIVSPWSTASDFNALTAGSYTVRVRDSKGCEVFTTVVLNNPTPIAFTATPTTTLLTCIRDTNASITVSVPTGGQGSNYLYTLNTTSATPMISSGPQSGNVFNNLGAGTYTVTVTDGWGCGTTSAPIVINEPTEVVASLVLATTQTCSTQSTITLSATGGTGTYQYSTTPNFATVAGSFASSITMSVPVGTYRFYVRDANGCISVVSNDITIDPLPALQVVLNVDNAKINCNGDTNGVIVATATGGLGNYVYTLLDGTGNPVPFTPVQTTPGNFTQLAAGTYQVRVDSQDCNVISTGVVTITEPLLPVTATTVVTPVTCNGAANGIINVTASGGTGVIKYAISPRLDQFFDTGVFDQLAPDTYQIIVQDENGCFILLSETITEPQPIFVNTVAGSEVQELCAGDNNAAFDVNITGGVAPYSVTLDDINGTYVTGALSQTVFNFTGLSGGEHTVYIKDANGCTAEWIVTLDESVNLDPKATVAYGCDNNSPSNTVTVTLDASITNPADVDYALDGSTVFQASNIFSNVAPGFHTITARHTNGCEKTTIQFEVLGFTPLALTLSDGGLNEIVATATGGAGNYQYSFDGGNTFSSNNKLIYYKSGDYTVIVRDANGCEATATRYFEFIDIEIPNVFTPNGDGNNDTWTPTNTINYKDLTINIFDRYGRKVATLREGQGWDGKYNSLELPTGDYWYVLKLRNVQDDREFVGHFTLMR